MASLEHQAVHAELLALQSALLALGAAFKKLMSGGALPLPSSTTCFASRRKRKQATLRKLYVAPQRRTAVVVDKEVQVPCLDDDQHDVVKVPCVDDAVSEVLETSLPTPAAEETHGDPAPMASHVDLFPSSSTGHSCFEFWVQSS